MVQFICLYSGWVDFLALIIFHQGERESSIVRDSANSGNLEESLHVLRGQMPYCYFSMEQLKSPLHWRVLSRLVKMLGKGHNLAGHNPVVRKELGFTDQMSSQVADAPLGYHVEKGYMDMGEIWRCYVEVVDFGDSASPELVISDASFCYPFFCHHIHGKGNWALLIQ